MRMSKRWRRKMMRVMIMMGRKRKGLMVKMMSTAVADCMADLGFLTSLVRDGGL